MQSKLKPFFMLFIVVAIFSCSKHDNPIAPIPEKLDTLGAGWQRIKIDSGLNFEDIYFLNNQTGFLCGERYVGKSTDGGLTWSRCIPDSLVGNFVNIWFSDASNGWVFGDLGFFLRTRDGGASWQRVVTKSGIIDGQFFDANNGYVIGLGGLYKTTDGGLTLQFITATAVSGNNLGSALFFINPNYGWFADNYLRTTKDGGNYFSVSSKPVSRGYTMQFTDTLHGWLAGYDYIYHTNDGGKTLDSITRAADVGGGDIHFFDNNNGFILSGPAIYSTADAGKTLTRLCAIHKGRPQEIYFTDIKHGWAAALDGYVYRFAQP
jgi:photosystem II stability/assembly factor-like uncharacterized protein